MKNEIRTISVLLAALTLGACVTVPPTGAPVRDDKKLVDTLTQLGAGYMERGELDVANHELEHALSINPDDSQANNIMGLLQARFKNDKKAEKYFRKSISEQPDNSDAQNNYGVFLCEHGRLKESEEHFKDALANPLYPTPELANVNAGLCFMKLPEPKRAENYFRAALENNPGQPVALYYMAKISFDQGNLLQARGFIQRYFTVAKDSPAPLLLAVRIERALGARNSSASYALRLRSLFPGSPEAKELRTLSRR